MDSKPKHFPPPGNNHRPMDFPPPMMDTKHITRKWLDLAYASQSSAQKLDIYLPESGEGPFPVIAAIHGGAWQFGDKGDAMNLPMLKGLDRGYAVVSINYRLSSEAQFPAQCFDCKAAIRFLRANATVYKLDSERIAVWGASSGGHLVSLLGTSAHIGELEDPKMGNPGFSAQVQAVVDWCGPTEDFIMMDVEFRKSGKGLPTHSEVDSPESLLLGEKITEIPDRVKFASPMTYINADAAYFLIQHGELDEVVPVEQSIRFAEEIKRKAGDQKAILEILPGVYHHGDPAFETPQNINRVLDFIDSCLKHQG